MLIFTTNLHYHASVFLGQAFYYLQSLMLDSIWFQLLKYIKEKLRILNLIIIQVFFNTLVDTQGP